MEPNESSTILHGQLCPHHFHIWSPIEHRVHVHSFIAITLLYVQDADKGLNNRAWSFFLSHLFTQQEKSMDMVCVPKRGT